MRYLVRWWVADPARRCAVFTGRHHEFADMESAADHAGATYDQNGSPVLVNPSRPRQGRALPAGPEWMVLLDNPASFETPAGRRAAAAIVDALAQSVTGPGFVAVTASGADGQRLVESGPAFDLCLGLHPRSAPPWVVEQGRLDWPLEAIAVRADDRGDADTLPHRWQCRRRKAG